MGDIQKVKFWCQKVLPLVYDDSLSYYEALCKILKKINEVIDYYNELQINIEEYVGKRINEVIEYIDDENEKQNIAVDEKIEAVYAEIQKQVDRLFNYIDDGDLILKNEFYEKFLELKKYIDEVTVGKILIYDPTTGYKDTITNVIDHIYDALRYWGVTCHQFDSNHLNCEILDNYHYTAKNFDLKSLEIFGKYYSHYLFNPINGAYEKIQNVLYQWFQVYRENAILINQFDSVDKDVLEIEDYEFTSFDFDTEAKTIFT